MAITIRKTTLGKSKYRVRVRDELGKYYPTKTYSTIREAKHYERTLIDRREKRENSVSTLKRNIEVHNYLDEWLDYRLGAISLGWHGKITQAVNTHILPLIGGIKLSDIRAPHVGRIMSEMENKGLKEQTRLHIFNILSKSFKDAVEYFGYLHKSPVLKQDKPKVHRIERNYLNPEQAYKLMEHCKNHFLGPAVWVCIMAGLRPSEVQALQWKNVDFDKSQILVCSAFKRAENEIKPYPKQKDWLIVPMPTMLSDYLKARKRFPLGFAAPAKMEGMLDYSKFYRGLKKLCREAAVDHVTPHELRHSCTEIWFRHGATLEDVRRLLGHKSVETTRRYVHRTDDRLIKLAKGIRAGKGPVGIY